MRHDPKIDALFQLPLDQFTQKRNALAKELSGESRKQVKFLTKPPLPIWAVNQLYWHDRPTYGALVDASEQLREAHRAALSGRKADIRKAEQLHRAAMEKAVAKTVALFEASQGRISDAARDTVRKALAALPNNEDSGRLTRAPEAAGFSLLAGIKPRETVGRDLSRALPKPARSTVARDLKRATAKAKAEAAAKARAERTARAREKEIATAELELKRARKAAERATFKVRIAEQKLQNLRIAD